MRRLREVLNARLEDRVIAAPGVYDMVSLRMAAAIGFEALYMTGYGTVASHLGLPDAGLASHADMVGRVEAMTRMVETPLIADGDTGYGGLLNVRHAVRGYERAGAAAIQLEDQEFPKKCGHTPDRRVIPADEMVRKIAVAVEARTSPDFLIIARTDARTSKGLPEAIRRARAYAEVGADMLFVELPETEDEMADNRPRAWRQAADRQHGRGRTHADVEQRAARRDRLRARHLSGRRPAERRRGAGHGLPTDPRDRLVARLIRAALFLCGDELLEGFPRGVELR